MLERYKREYVSTIVRSLKLCKVQPEVPDLYALFHYPTSLAHGRNVTHHIASGESLASICSRERVWMLAGQTGRGMVVDIPA